MMSLVYLGGHMTSPDPGHANVALVTNTLLARAAEAMVGPALLTWRAFCDLSALCEAAVLLDRVAVIRAANVAGVPEALAPLAQAGIIHPFEPTVSRLQLGALLNSLPEEVARWLQVDDMLPPRPDAPMRTFTSTPFLNSSGAVSVLDYQTSADELLTQLNRLVMFPSSPPEIAAANDYVTRSLGYLVVAAANGLDHFPDHDRAPFVAGFVRRLYRSLPVRLYATVAEALAVPDPETLVSEWTLDTSLPVPPVTALVLQRARSLDDIPGRILEIRDDFAAYRDRFRRFKAELQASDTLSERRRLVGRYRALLEAASGPDAEVISAMESLNFAAHVVGAGANPLSPTSYSAELIRQPVHWIRRWWLRRPLAVLFRMDGKLPRLSQYGEIVDRLWGPGAHEGMAEDAAMHAPRVGRMLAGS
jgi:hypothetical protein